MQRRKHVFEYGEGTHSCTWEEYSKQEKQLPWQRREKSKGKQRNAEKYDRSDWQRIYLKNHKNQFASSDSRLFY